MTKKSTHSDAETEALRQRNLQRAREAIEKLGRKYACHPVNAPRKLAPATPLLG